MKSFVFQKDNSQIPNTQKPVQKPPHSNTNPFFQYINNNKPTNPSSNLKSQPYQNVSPLDMTFGSTNPQRKSSISSVNDPRKIYIPAKKTNQNQINTSGIQKVQQKNKPLDQNISEKRSRSRDKGKSRNRSSSSDSFKKQKKDQYFHKTKLCPLFQKGQCKKSQCNFAHGQKQLRRMPNFFKTRLCLAFQRSDCKKPTNQCKYAHGQKQLRVLKNEDVELNKKSISQKKKQKQNHKQGKSYKQDKYKNERNSSSSHRNNKQKRQKQDSKDRYIDKYKIINDPVFYKKNIPLSKDYQKFLYGDVNSKLDPHSPEVQNNNFVYNKDMLNMIPNQPHVPSYPVDYYSVNHKKQINPSKIPGRYPEFQMPFRQNSRQFYNSQQISNPLPYNDKNPGFYKNNNIYPGGVNKPYNQPNFCPQNPYSAAMNTQLPKNFQYPNFYQNNGSFTAENLNEFNKNFNYGAQKSFIDQNKASFYRDNRVPETLNYRRDLGSGNISGRYPAAQNGYEKQYQQNFYKNDSINPSLYKRSQKQVFNNYQNNVKQHENSFRGNGVYDLYPALDKTAGLVPMNPYNQNKGKY